MPASARVAVLRPLLLTASLTALSGCAAAPADVAIPTPVIIVSAATGAEPARLPATTRQVNVRWSHFAPTDGCFYFCGPAEYGRDLSYGNEARWRQLGERLTLAFGKASFSGAVKEDGSVRLRRSSTVKLEGHWDVSETIVGTVQADTLRGRYRYEECARSRPDEPCPGRCVLQAEVEAGSRLGEQPDPDDDVLEVQAD